MDRIAISYQEKGKVLTFTAVSCIGEILRCNLLSSGAVDKGVRAPNYLEGPRKFREGIQVSSRILQEWKECTKHWMYAEFP